MTTAEEAIDQPLASDSSWTGAHDKRSNYAVVLYGADDMRFEEAPELGTLKESHVRIQIKAVGICGTDIHFLKKVCSVHMHACSCSHPPIRVVQSRLLKRGTYAALSFAGWRRFMDGQRPDGHRARGCRVSSLQSLLCFNFVNFCTSCICDERMQSTPLHQLLHSVTSSA